MKTVDFMHKHPVPWRLYISLVFFNLKLNFTSPSWFIIWVGGLKHRGRMNSETFFYLKNNNHPKYGYLIQICDHKISHKLFTLHYDQAVEERGNSDYHVKIKWNLIIIIPVMQLDGGRYSCWMVFWSLRLWSDKIWLINSTIRPILYTGHGRQTI